MKIYNKKVVVCALIGMVGVIGMTLIKMHWSHPVKRHAPLATVTVQVKSVTTPLFFHGVLQPVSSDAILSPVSGRVTQVFFKYGVHIKHDQELFTIASKELRDKFNQDLDSFLQKRASYDIQQSNYKGSESLYHHGALAKDTFLNDQNAYYGAKLSFLQSKSELEKVLTKVNIDPKRIENLTYQQDEKIKSELHDRFDRIQVLSSKTGVALFPLENQVDSDGLAQDNKISVGSDVKEDQLMVSVGDLSGYRVSLQVNEMQVNKIKPHMAVKVTGDAFPGGVLVGRVDTVALQAAPGTNTNSNMAMFDVSVVIPKVPSTLNKVIHVGMTCQVEVDLHAKPELMVPVSAVRHDEQGSAQVWVVTPSGGRNVPVITGMTTPAGEVAVLHGLTAGERVYVNR